MSRRLALTALLAASALAFAAPVRYAEDRAPAIVNPLFATSMSEARLNELVFEGLFADDQDLRSTPKLALAWELAEDRMSMRVRLRQGVLWHDGEPFTADDVLFTINAMRNPTTASTEAGRVAWIRSATKVSELELDLTFVAPEYSPQDKLHFKIVPAHAFKSTAVSRTDAFRTSPIGTGPYRVAKFNDDNSISMDRWGGYWGTSYVDTFVLREVADPNYQAKLLSYDSLESLVRVLPRDLATLRADRRVELYPYQTNSWWYIGFNQRKANLQEPEVRKALSLMVDASSLLAPIGTGELLSGPFVRSSPFYNHDVPVSQADPERAAALLTEAGYQRTASSWVRNGEPLTLQIVTQQNLETAQDVVINLQAQLQRQGVEVKPVFLTPADWKQRVWREGDFDLVLSQWSFDRNEDIYEQFHSKGSRNFVHFKEEAVDTLLDQAREAADPQRKKALMRQVHAHIAQDNPMIFLWTLDSYSAVSTRIQHVVIHPFYYFTWANEWTTN